MQKHAIDVRLIILRKFQMRDIIGMFLSFLCIFHCVGLPFLLPLLTEMNIGLEGEQIHMGLLVAVFIYTALFLWPYANKINIAISIVGLIVLSGALQFHGAWETAFTIVGSLCLMTAHLMDFKLKQKANDS